MKLKRLLSVFLAVIMVLSTGIVAFADETEFVTFTEGIFTYSLRDGNVRLEKCDPSVGGKVVIPDETEQGYKVIAISYTAFKGCADVTEIEIGENLYLETHQRFSDCNNIVRFSIDKNNKSCCADEYGVLYSADKTIMIAYPPASPVEDYVIPDGVVTINAVFKNCVNLKTLTVPESLAFRSGCDFENCPNLTDIYFGGTERDWQFMDGASWLTEKNNITMHYRAENIFDFFENASWGLGAFFGPLIYVLGTTVGMIVLFPVNLVRSLIDWIKSI